MQGVLDNPELEGIIPRMIRYIYDTVQNSASEDIQYLIKVSMVEIYNEKIRVKCLLIYNRI